MINGEKSEKNIKKQVMKNLKAIMSGYGRTDTVPCSGSLLYDVYKLLQDERKEE